MTQDDLNAAIVKTGHARLRWLVSDANLDAASREGYRRTVVRLAGEASEPSRPTVGEVLASLKLVKACPHLTPPDCGCNFGRCSKHGRPTSFPECLACGAYKEALESWT